MGIPFTIATSSSEEQAKLKLEKANLLHFFEDVEFATDGKNIHGKPFPDIFWAAARIIKQEPANCWCFDDHPLGIKAAIDGGFIPTMIPDVVDINVSGAHRWRSLQKAEQELLKFSDFG